MADNDQTLIEIPEDDELLTIANAANEGQFGTENDEGDLPGWPLEDLGGGDNTETEARPSVRKSPIRGAVAYLPVGIPMSVYHAFTGYDERRIKVDGAAWEALHESDRLIIYLENLVGRDMQADERRAPEDKVYWFAGLFRGATFKSLVEAAHTRDDEAEFAKRQQLVRVQQRTRFRQRFGDEWTDDQIDDVLGPLAPVDD